MHAENKPHFAILFSFESFHLETSGSLRFLFDTEIDNVSFWNILLSGRFGRCR